jgi:hypothetical protein
MPSSSLNLQGYVVKRVGWHGWEMHGERLISSMNSNDFLP